MVDDATDTDYDDVKTETKKLEIFQLPDDWRPQASEDQSSWCQTCWWNGDWASLLRRANLKLISRCCPLITKTSLKSSASTGNFCCAVLLSLASKYLPNEETVTVTINFSGEFVVFDEQFQRCPPWGPISLHTACPPHMVHDLPPWISSDSYQIRPSIETGSVKSVAWARRHIATCLSEHSCQSYQSEDKTLPTRLIEIPHDPVKSGIKLRDSSALHQGTRYTALSHCWGTKTPPCLTTSDNLQNQLQGIPWAVVPQSFRDAVLFTKALGIRYIWIDSMCIVQGDEDDWIKESDLMFNYYSNAHVTLAAASSADCDGGLFTNKLCDRTHLLNFTFRGKEYPLFATETPSELLDFTEAAMGLGQEVEHKYPLLSRAWAFQERLVSPRVIYFTASQLIWDCYSACAFEEDMARGTESGQMLYQSLKQSYLKLLHQPGASSASDKWTKITHEFSRFQLTDSKGPSSAVSSQPLGDIDSRACDTSTVDAVTLKTSEQWHNDMQSTEETAYGSLGDASPSRRRADAIERGYNMPRVSGTFSLEWNQVLQAYSQLQLSDPRDRLPAIAAVAEQILARQYDDPAAQYLCGLRKDALHLDLLWTPAPDTLASGVLRHRPCNKGSAYVAPSWSWASYPGRLMDNTAQCEVWGTSSIRFVRDELVFNESRRFSRVLGGHIVIEGLVVECTLDTVPDESSSTAAQTGTRILRIAPQHDIEIVLDYNGEYEDIEAMGGQGQSQLCLLQTWAGPVRETAGALALHRNVTTGLYTRLGARMRDRPRMGEEMPWGLVSKKMFERATYRILKLE